MATARRPGAGPERGLAGPGSQRSGRGRLEAPGGGAGAAPGVGAAPPGAARPGPAPHSPARGLLAGPPAPTMSGPFRLPLCAGPEVLYGASGATRNKPRGISRRAVRGSRSSSRSVTSQPRAACPVPPPPGPAPPPPGPEPSPGPGTERSRPRPPPPPGSSTWPQHSGTGARSLPPVPPGPYRRPPRPPRPQQQQPASNEHIQALLAAPGPLHSAAPVPTRPRRLLPVLLPRGSSAPGLRGRARRLLGPLPHLPPLALQPRGQTRSGARTPGTGPVPPGFPPPPPGLGPMEGAAPGPGIPRGAPPPGSPLPPPHLPAHSLLAPLRREESSR